MLKTFFYIELFTQAQDAGALELLKFPRPPLLAPASTRTGSLRAARSVKRLRSFEKLLDYAATQPFNQIKIVHQPQAYPLAQTPLHVIGITQEFYLSPTNALWANTAQWPPAKTHFALREFWNTQSEEQGIARNSPGRYPSVLCTFIELADEPSAATVYTYLPEMLAASLANASLEGEIVGGGGFETLDQTGEYTSIMTSEAFLQRWAKSFSFLGQRFGTLQPIMIGNTALCTELFNALTRSDISNRDGVKLIKKENPQGNSDLSVVYLPEDVLKDPASEVAARNQLVPRDEATKTWRPRQ